MAAHERRDINFSSNVSKRAPKLVRWREDEVNIVTVKLGDKDLCQDSQDSV
jgi:hypothetical protein